MAFNAEETIKEIRDLLLRIPGAKDQAEYEGYYDAFFEKLDQLDERLETERFLGGNKPSQADFDLYDILVKWDIVDFFALRLNRNRLKDFKNLWPYAKNIYQNEGKKDDTDFEQIKRDYYGNLDDVRNPYHIIPLGPDTSGWEE